MKTMKKVNTVEKVDLNNYTLKQKQSLQKGYEIWCSGCLSGDWEDEGILPMEIRHEEKKVKLNKSKK